MSFRCERCNLLMPLNDIFSIGCGHLYHGVCLEIIFQVNPQCTTCNYQVNSDPVLLQPTVDQEPLAEEMENNHNNNENNDVHDDEDDQVQECDNCARMQTIIDNISNELDDALDMAEELVLQRDRIAKKQKEDK